MDNEQNPYSVNPEMTNAMLSITIGDVHLIGNFNKVTKRKPKNWINNGYKIIVPYDFKWRHKVGKVECTCVTCEEHYQPWYGTSWHHSKDCAMIKHIEKNKGIFNLKQYYDWDYKLIAQTE